MAYRRSSFLYLFLLLTVVAGYLRKAPAYDEYLSMAAASIHGPPSNNSKTKDAGYKSPFHDADGNNYLVSFSHHQQLTKKHSKDPSALEKLHRFSKIDICNMVRPNVSRRCCSDMEFVFTSAAKQESWAIQMIDAFGKIPSGVLEGNIYFVGSYDECLAVSVTNGSVDNPFRPKYCQVYATIESTPSAMMKYGVCVPDSCKPAEIEFMINKGFHLLPVHIKGIQPAYTDCPQKEGYSARALFSLIASSFFIILLVTATLYDVFVIQLDWKPTWTTEEGDKSNEIKVNYGLSRSISEGTKASSEKTPPSSTSKELGRFQKFLLCFSIHKNATKLFKTDLPKGSLTSVHGIRFISMTWVILGHTYVFGMSVWSNSKMGQELMARFTFQAIGNATVSVDTFFLLSGLLVVYGVLHNMETNNGKVNWFYYYVHRFWRLTPPYMLVMLVYVPLLQYWGDGPFWPIHGSEIDYCRNSWWYNLLYINNFYDKECMAWSWYLANDMQFYAISPIILIFLYKKPKIGYGIISFLMLAQVITCAVIMKEKDYVGLLSPGFFNQIYVKPYTRIGSYLVGMMYGYLLFKTKGKVVINRSIVAMLWLFATICAIAILYGLYDTFHGPPLSVDVLAFYTAVHRIVWALAVGWVLFACVTGYGGFVNTILSWKPFIPLSRLTYCAYLVHPIIMVSFYLDSRYPIYLTDFETIYLFFGHLVMSYLVAFVVSMAFEAPMIALESLLRGKR